MLPSCLNTVFSVYPSFLFFPFSSPFSLQSSTCSDWPRHSANAGACSSLLQHALASSTSPTSDSYPHSASSARGAHGSFGSYLFSSLRPLSPVAPPLHLPALCALCRPPAPVGWASCGMGLSDDETWSPGHMPHRDAWQLEAHQGDLPRADSDDAQSALPTSGNALPRAKRVVLLGSARTAAIWAPERPHPRVVGHETSSAVAAAAQHLPRALLRRWSRLPFGQYGERLKHVHVD